MKILFSMRHPGALRNFASTVEELARRGHQIHLLFMRRDKLGELRLAQELCATHPSVGCSEVLDKAQNAWRELARTVRSAADFARYQTPAYANAPALRDRATRHLTKIGQRLVLHPFFRNQRGLTVLTSVLRLVERAIPPDPRVLDVVRKHAPDLLLVTPLVDFGSDQEEYLKAAQALGIPTAVCVHSWDNLTNKGLIHVPPDRVFVWNDAQVREAVTMHGIAAESVVATGAPCYDQWFARQPSETREAFCAKVGLPSDKPYFLYLCSSQFIAPREADFVKRWIEALRSAPDGRVREAGILVRPHPRNDMSRWRRFDLSSFGDVTLWPEEGTNPVDPATKNDYFDSLYHSAAAVGINTSAQIEAGIVGRQVFSIRAPEYTTTQEGTLHFHYLLSEHGGLLHMAQTLDEHTRSLAGVFDRRDQDERRLRDFVCGFVRPLGLELPATPLLASAIEQLAQTSVRRPVQLPLWLRLTRRALQPLAVRMKSEGPARIKDVPSSPAERDQFDEEPRVGALR